MEILKFNYNTILFKIAKIPPPSFLATFLPDFALNLLQKSNIFSVLCWIRQTSNSNFHSIFEHIRIRNIWARTKDIFEFSQDQFKHRIVDCFQIKLHFLVWRNFEPTIIFRRKRRTRIRVGPCARAYVSRGPDWCGLGSIRWFSIDSSFRSGANPIKKFHRKRQKFIL